MIEAAANRFLCIGAETDRRQSDGPTVTSRAVVFIAPSRRSRRLAARFYADLRERSVEREAETRYAGALRELYRQPDVAWAWWASLDHAKLQALPEHSFRNLLERLAEVESLSGTSSLRDRDSVLQVIVDHLNRVDPAQHQFAAWLFAAYLEKLGDTDLVERLGALGVVPPITRSSGDEELDS